MRCVIRYMLPGILLLLCVQSYAQTTNYILNGAAVQNNCYCYTLTEAFAAQAGSVWNKTKISLQNSFDFAFNVFAGCKDVDGADGLVFILQPLSTSLGGSGEGIGFSGISPSIGIALDTYRNDNLHDPDFDHISIQSNGNSDHLYDLAGPVPISAFTYNIEDCQWHTLRIKWDSAAMVLQAYYDAELRVEKQIDLVKDIFNNDPMVYWGFTAATGGLSNIQRFCTALNPSFSTNHTGNRACVNTPINFTDESQSFLPIVAHYWDFGDGATSTAINPVHTYTAPGEYTVKCVITGFDGCNSDTLKQPYYIGDKPIAAFTVTDSCSGTSLGIDEQSSVQYGKVDTWKWILDGAVISVDEEPGIIISKTGSTQLKLVAGSDYGCLSDTASAGFVVIPSPAVEAVFTNGCSGDSVVFTGHQTDAATSITAWQWALGNNDTVPGQVVTKRFAAGGVYPIKLQAFAGNGCSSPTVNDDLLINEVIADAGNDTLVIKGVPFVLNGAASYKGSTSPVFLWTPGSFLNNAATSKPTATITDDQLFTLKVTSAEGCTDTSSVFVTVFKGSAVYVPTGFTPNHDGRNDVLHPLYIGIKRLEYFTIYSRLGQKVFQTQDLAKGWDGRINGNLQDNGTYVWMLKAEDIVGKIYQLKGTVTIVK